MRDKKNKLININQTMLLQSITLVNVCCVAKKDLLSSHDLFVSQSEPASARANAALVRFTCDEKMQRKRMAHA